MQARTPAILLSALLVSCGTRDGAEHAPGEGPPTGPSTSQPVDSPPADALAVLREHVKELEASSEHSEGKVVVQHLLIGFQGSVPGKPITRTQTEAEELTAQLWARVQAGDDFDALVREHTDDSHPGIYTMRSDPGAVAPGEFHRGGMVPAFGNVGWRLKVGEAGVAGYGPASPYGWHIVKRIE